MNFKEYDELIINGKPLKGASILAFCQKSEAENIQELGRFMAEWMDTKSTIKIKTSGSTGIPKEIQIEKSKMLESAAATAKFFNFKEHQTALLCLPMSYIAGKMMVVRALLNKLNLICIAPDRTPLLQISQNTEIDFAPLTPMQLESTSDTRFVKTILLGGGPVNPAEEERFQSLQSEIYHGYGMTETLSHVAIRKINGKDKSEKYEGLQGVNFELDARGCLVIHVPFLKNPVVTNDLVTLIDATTFLWKGRIDNVINSGGIKLFPEEIEKKIFPFIPERFFVASIPDEILGEKGCLFIEGKSYSENKLKSLKSILEKYLNRYEKPKCIYFIECFLTTESGKVKRRATVCLRGKAIT